MKIYLVQHYLTHETCSVHRDVNKAYDAQDVHQEEVVEWDTKTQERRVLEDRDDKA